MLSFLRRKKSFAVYPSGNTITGSLPELFVSVYGFDHFTICSVEKGVKHAFTFDFDRDFYKSLSSMALSDLYDSIFYTFVSMYLTRKERDKFIKLFRRG